MLEMENHFTDRHRHKEDIRRLEGVISCALHPFSVRDDSPAFRSKTLGTLAADIIPGLTALRRAKNITWRLFGMQREARRIEEQIAGMQKQKASPAELQAMGRRTALYLETLQSIGSDLLRLARETKAVSADEIDKRVGEVNIAGYYLSRGQQPSQGNSIERIKQQIAELLALTTGTFGAFVKEETEARAKLNQLYDSILASTAAAGGSPGARKWLAKDASSMQLDPFHAHWPIFLRLALMGEPGAVPASTLLDPAAPLHEAIANEQRTADELAFQWEINHVISNDAAPVEKAVELAVISSEKQKTFGMLIGDKPSTVIPIPDPAVSVSEADFAQFVGRLASSEGTNAKTAILKYRDAIKTQAAAAEKQINGLFEHALRELTSASASMEKAIASVAEAAAGGQEQLRERVQNVCALAQAERDLLASVAALGYARLCFLYDDAQAPQTEKLMLRMRELQQRYQSRLEPVLASITKAALNPQGTSGVAAVQNDVQQLQVLHDAVQSRLEALIAAYGGEGIPDEDNGRQYMLLADFRRTAELLSEAKAAVDAHLTADAVAAFLERFPEAGVYNILAHASSLQLLHESLGEMQTCLKAQTVSMRALTDSWNAAMRNLASLVAVVEQSGPGEYQQRISGRLQQLSGRLERVKPQAQEGDRLDPAQTTRLLYDIEQIMANLGGLQRELRFIAETLQDDRTAAKGGPPGIWEPELQRSAEFAQKRTLALAGEAQRRVFTAILDELNANSSDTAAEAYAWAVLLHRMVRSELYGVGVIRSPRAEAVEAADPHLAFLEEEIRNALQAADVKYYSRIVEEYLKSLRDFLRY